MDKYIATIILISSLALAFFSVDLGWAEKHHGGLAKIVVTCNYPNIRYLTVERNFKRDTFFIEGEKWNDYGLGHQLVIIEHRGFITGIMYWRSLSYKTV